MHYSGSDLLFVSIYFRHIYMNRRWYVQVAVSSIRNSDVRSTFFLDVFAARQSAYLSQQVRACVEANNAGFLPISFKHVSETCCRCAMQGLSPF